MFFPGRSVYRHIIVFFIVSAKIHIDRWFCKAASDFIIQQTVPVFITAGIPKASSLLRIYLFNHLVFPYLTSSYRSG